MFISLYRNFQLGWAYRQGSLRGLWQIIRLMLVYQKLDGHMARFRRQTGIACFKGCGECCENPYVETTVLEMMPLAAELLRRDKFESWLYIQNSDMERGRCPFYVPDNNVAGNGRCSVYSFRPLICRLFGYSAKLNKNKLKEYYSCKRIKSSIGEACKQICSQPEKISIPLVQEYSTMRMEIAREIDPNLYPLSVALKLAIERIGLYFQMKKKTDFYGRK